MRTTFGTLRLQAHQINVCKLIVKDTPGLLLFYKVGSGKTLAAIAAAENLAAFEKRERRVVVILPASLRDNFRKEMRAAQVRSPGRYTILSFHQVHRMTPQQRTELGSGGFLIIDEVQNLRNPANPSVDGVQKATMLDSVLEVARAAGKRLLLSGTPMMNWPFEIGSSIGLIDPERFAEIAIKKMAFNPRNGRHEFQPQFVPNFGKEANKHRDRLARMLRCAILFYEPPPSVVRAHYPTKTEHIVRVPLSPLQLKEHGEVIQDMGDAVENNAANAFNLEDLPDNNAYLARMRMLCNAVRGSHPKMDEAVNRIATEVARGGKCVVFSSYLMHGLHKMQRLLAARGVPCVVFEGATADRLRPEIVRKYNSGEVPVIMLSEAGKEGLDLKNTTQVHIMEPQWNEEKVHQAIGRAIRYKSHTGPNRHVDVFRYVAYIRPRDVQAGPGNDWPHDDYPKAYKTGDVRLWELSKTKHESIDNFTTWLVQLSDVNLRTCV